MRSAMLTKKMKRTNIEIPLCHHRRFLHEPLLRALGFTE